MKDSVCAKIGLLAIAFIVTIVGSGIVVAVVLIALMILINSSSASMDMKNSHYKGGVKVQFGFLVFTKKFLVKALI